jgi:hypothetical protein
VAVTPWGAFVAPRRPLLARRVVPAERARNLPDVSAPEWTDIPDVDVLTRVRDGLRSLPEQERRPDAGSSPAAEAPAVPLPRRR